MLDVGCWMLVVGYWLLVIGAVRIIELRRHWLLINLSRSTLLAPRLSFRTPQSEIRNRKVPHSAFASSVCIRFIRGKKIGMEFV